MQFCLDIVALGGLSCCYQWIRNRLMQLFDQFI